MIILSKKSEFDKDWSVFAHIIVISHAIMIPTNRFVYRAN